MNGYRPLFDVLEGTKTSGMFVLKESEKFFPGQEGIAEIKFVQADLYEGKKFNFYEGGEVLGEGEIIEILD